MRTIKEILILAGCLCILPVFAIFVLYQYGALDLDLLYRYDSLQLGLLYPIRRILLGGVMNTLDLLAVFFWWVSPYLITQAVRAYVWSKKSLSGRKWANFYFFTILAVGAVFFFAKALDLLYFMYALGDMPEELVQFFELEGVNVLLFILTAFLAVSCFRTWVNPERRLGPPQSSS
ncbi:hypothetical protein ACFL2Q_11705 [Thermodesulfobacteriota bacterium]